MNIQHLYSLLLLLIPFIMLGSETTFVPWAEGWGAATKGGTGAKVFHVSTLEDNPVDPKPGSLRYEVENRTEPRVIVFDVGGTITLKKGLILKTPFVTINGHTAPGNGITLTFLPEKDAYQNSTGGHLLLIIGTQEVILRGLKFRRGNTADKDYIKKTNEVNRAVCEYQLQVAPNIEKFNGLAEQCVKSQENMELLDSGEPYRCSNNNLSKSNCENVAKLQALKRFKAFDFNPRGLRQVNGCALSIVDSSKILVDHSSFSWTTDETIAIGNEAPNPQNQTHHITVQNSIISDALVEPRAPRKPPVKHLPDSKFELDLDGTVLFYPKGHPLGLLVWHSPSTPEATQISIVNNLFANNRHRNPRVCGHEVEVIGNYIYNWLSRAVDLNPSGKMDLIGNVFEPKRSVAFRRSIVQLDKQAKIGKIYISGNRVVNHPDSKYATLIGEDNRYLMFDQGEKDLTPLENLVSKKRTNAVPIRTKESSDPITEWTKRRMAFVGDSFHIECDGSLVKRRDPVDQGLIDYILNPKNRALPHPHNPSEAIAPYGLIKAYLDQKFSAKPCQEMEVSPVIQSKNYQRLYLAGATP